MIIQWIVKSLEHLRSQDVHCMLPITKREADLISFIIQTNDFTNKGIRHFSRILS